MARTHPVSVVAGDGVAGAARLVAAAPAGLHPIVMHSFVLNQVDADARDALDRSLATMSHDRAVDRLSYEWITPDPGPMLRLTRYRNGASGTTTLAAAHHHGAWIEWLDRASAA
jgi:hypothetical protein